MSERSTNDGASKKASAGGPKDGKRHASEFRVLPESATYEERVTYIKKHAGAATRARCKELKHSWCIGREIPKIKAEKNLNNNEADACLKATFGFGVRQGNNYEQLWQAFPSIEEMLKKVPESASLSTAVDIARSLLDPRPEPDPVPPKRVGNGGGKKPPKPLNRTPRSQSKAAELLDDILRMVVELGDEDLALLSEVHSLLTTKKASDGAGANKVGGASKHTPKSRTGG